MVDIYEAFEAGNHDEARRIHERVQVLNRFLEYDPGYVAPCKYALELRGYSAGPVRKPLPDLSEEERRLVREALSQLGYAV
jgi:dihydrodipicolinate synthase/N-acetylneuraminate lyase